MQASEEMFRFPLDSKEDGRDTLWHIQLPTARGRAWRAWSEMPRSCQKG